MPRCAPHVLVIFTGRSLLFPGWGGAGRASLVKSNLVRVDKDEAVIGVEAAGGELLLDCLARQLGRTSDLGGVMVMIID